MLSPHLHQSMFFFVKVQRLMRMRLGMSVWRRNIIFPQPQPCLPAGRSLPALGWQAHLHRSLHWAVMIFQNTEVDVNEFGHCWSDGYNNISVPSMLSPHLHQSLQFLHNLTKNGWSSSS
jgi:hypothetical protein